MPSLPLVSALSLALGIASAVYIVFDLTKRPQRMTIMYAVWPLCALFAGPILIAFYLVYGRGPKPGNDVESHHHHSEKTPFPAAVAKGALHCGAGCTLGDILAESLAGFFPGVLALFGYPALFSERMFAAWGLDFVFAFVIGIIFQYFAIAPMRGLSPGKGVVAALKADTLSLSSWQIGMYGTMAFARFLVFGEPLEPDTALFWFVMQIAMIAGFITAYPTNWFLIRTGIKERM